MRSGFARAVRGYIALARSIGAVAAALVSSLAISVLLVFPLWWLATERRGIYNILVLGLVSAGVLFLAIKGIVRKQSQQMQGELQLSDKRHRALPRVLIVVVLLVAAYSIAALFSSGVWMAAIPATLVFLGLLGYLLRVPVAGIRQADRGNGNPESDRQDA